MASQMEPTEPPPPYSQDPSGHLAVPVGGAAASTAPRHRRSPSAGSTASSNYTSEDDREDEGGIPSEARRELLDAERPLPEGWRREFDRNSEHFFYVDTKANPPRSIWSHPLDDPDFLRANPEIAQKYAPPPGAPPGDSSTSSSGGTTPAHSSSADEKHRHSFGRGEGDDGHKKGETLRKSRPVQQQQQQQQQHNTQEKHDDRTLGRRMKDKLTGSTHEERVAERKKRAEEEKRQYDEYLRRRGEMLRAVNQGRYQTSYSAPAGPYRVQPLYGGMYGSSRYGGGGYGGYARYPAGPMGYGSGIGMMRPGMGMGMGGMGLGMGAGLLGGLMIGDMMF
ncbi:hypothetical protein JCM3770_005930 [Rhodotorula araucariae]